MISWWTKAKKEHNHYGFICKLFNNNQNHLYWEETSECFSNNVFGLREKWEELIIKHHFGCDGYIHYLDNSIDFKFYTCIKM